MRIPILKTTILLNDLLHQARAFDSQ